MAVAQGYNKTSATDSLVFMYDTGDTTNCYLGEPTTNVVNTNGQGYNPLDLYTWASSGNTSTWSRDPSSELSPVGGIPLKEISFGTDSYSGTYNSSVWSLGAASAGQTWTVSVYAKAAAGTNLQLWLFEANSNGNYIAISADSFAATGNWQRLYITRTLTDGSTTAVQARVATATNGATIWWDGLVMEQKPYATQFTPSSRSVTGSLFNLLNKTGINVGSVSYTTTPFTPQITFDGTDDIIQVPAAPWNILQTFTLEAIFKANGTAGSGYHVLFQKEGGFSGGAVYGLRAENAGGNLFAMICYDAQAVNALTLGSTTLVTNGKYYHVVSTFDSSYNWKIYINGVLENSRTLITVPFQNTSPIFIGRGDGRTMNGDLPISKIYNRALSTAEVLNNYNNYKTRFNLS
jgi:hypothetical protein